MRGVLGVSLAVLVLVGCGGDDSAPPPGDAGPVSDAGRRDSGPIRDAGTRDAPTGDPCLGVECGPFERCFEGGCEPFPSCVTDTMCAMGEVCRHRFCIPVDADPDGDGSPAGEDCDETDPEISPDATEVCNARDDDCNGEIDEGDPGELCAMDPSGGVCIDGGCGCPGGTFDLDRNPSNGCECTALPALSQGVSCGEAIDLGDVPDTGGTVTVSGNVLPDDREVWYRFRGVDTADTSCDNLHVRVQLTTNPGDAFGFNVLRGDCATEECPGTVGNDYSFATDFRTAALVGECPCTDPAGLTATNVSVCADQSAQYSVRVVRRPGGAVTCDTFTLEITNGVYDTPP